MTADPDLAAISAMGAASARIVIAWIGHSTALIELDGTRILTDPVLRNRVGPLVRITSPVDLERLGHVDCVVLSHLHADHTDPASIRLLGRDVPVLAPSSSARWLGSKGLLDVRELAPGDTASLGRLQIRAVRAVHDRKRTPLLGPAADPLGFLIAGSKAVYFAGDTDLFDEMAELQGLVDVALLPVSGWGPRVPRGHLDPARAAEAARLIAPRIAIPIHWGTLARPRPASRPHDPAAAAHEFAAATRKLAPDVMVRVLMPGEQALL
jgi:L-ascorbate metabolism protein UlaG (beta-lactamase superfamily)